MPVERPSCKTCDHIFRQKDPQNIGASTWRCGLNPPQVSVFPKPGAIPGSVDIGVISQFPPIQLDTPACSHHPSIQMILENNRRHREREISKLTTGEPEEDVTLVDCG